MGKILIPKKLSIIWCYLRFNMCESLKSIMLSRKTLQSEKKFMPNFLANSLPLGDGSRLLKSIGTYQNHFANFSHCFQGRVFLAVDLTPSCFRVCPVRPIWAWATSCCPWILTCRVTPGTSRPCRHPRDPRDPDRHPDQPHKQRP